MAPGVRRKPLAGRLRDFRFDPCRFGGRSDEMDYVAERAPKSWQGEHERFVALNQQPVEFSLRSESEEVDSTVDSSTEWV